jgi:uncharacterized membrane protein YcaP (DUF421 family)
METMVRGAVIYLFLLVLFRFSGKRSLATLTTFDFVLLLIVAEATQQTMLGEDFSVTNGLLLIGTLVGIDVFIAFCKQKSRTLEKWIEGLPLVLVENGEPVRGRMEKARVDEDDVLAAARETQGLERMDQIKYAVLERSGGISIVPKG